MSEISYEGTWVVFYADGSGMSCFPTPEMAYQYFLTRTGWITFLRWGQDIAELADQIRAVPNSQGLRVTM